MPRRTVTQLATAFRTAHENLKDTPPTDERYDGVLAVCTKLANRIVATRADPANAVAEMLMKIAAAGWVNGTSEPLDRWTECADLDIAQCLVSIRKDLQAMEAAPPTPRLEANRTPYTRRCGAFKVTSVEISTDVAK